MVASALLSAEVAEHSSCALGRPGGVSLLSQARLTLGPVGTVFASFSYVFLHFAVSLAIYFLSPSDDATTEAST
jgi:tyrosine-specific transport protein